MTPIEISPREFHERWQQAAERCLLLDVRTPVEYREKRAAMAKSMPLAAVSAERVRAASQGRDVFLICKSGARARQAADKLNDEGFASTTLVTGGTDGWVAAQLPTMGDTGVISLERQVRIGAGALVTLFSILSLAVDHRFAGGALFIGCGLIFAGITNWCGMGLLLARMPWNRSAGGASCSVRPPR